MLSHNRRKNSLDSQSAFCTHSAVCSLHFVPSLHFVSGLQSAVCMLYQQVSVATIQFIFGYSYSHNTHNLPQNTCVLVTRHFRSFPRYALLSFCKNADITYNVSSNLLTPSPPKNNSCMHSMPVFLEDGAFVNRRVDEVWSEIFNMKNPVTGQQRFPVLRKFITGLLVIPHKNADYKRLFSTVRKN